MIVAGLIVNMKDCRDVMDHLRDDPRGESIAVHHDIEWQAVVLRCVTVGIGVASRGRYAGHLNGESRLGSSLNVARLKIERNGPVVDLRVPYQLWPR